VQQPVVAGDPEEQPAERQAEEHEHGAVEGDRGPGVLAALAQELGHHRGRERDQCRPQQHDQVEDQQRAVHLDHLGEDAVMVEPDHPDGQEAHQVGDVARPLPQQGMGQRLALAHLGGCSSMTRRVMAMANTPSLKASSRFLVTAATIRAAASGRHASPPPVPARC
jgi:hypothetical protein